jgi:hypothetical protein
MNLPQSKIEFYEKGIKIGKALGKWAFGVIAGGRWERPAMRSAEGQEWPGRQARLGCNCYSVVEMFPSVGWRQKQISNLLKATISI